MRRKRFLIAGLFYLHFCQQPVSGSRIKQKHADSCLVISPVGIAMIQGEMKGKLRWDEIRKVVPPRTAKGVQVQAAMQGLQLHVDGSTIVVLDIYNVPLSEIEQRIVRNL